MAVLGNADRVDVWTRWMRENFGVIGGSISKTDIRAAVDAADDWANTNAAAYNLALPLISRTNLTSLQKAAILEFVIRRRFEIS